MPSTNAPRTAAAVAFAPFDLPDFDDHEQLVFAHDAASGLKAIIAVHNTRLGPALGGCRIKRYPATEDAVTDALRLAQGMTYKAALADLPLGGGKSVVLADARTEKTPEMMRAMGRAVERLGGRYIAAEDIGATPADMDAMATETAHVSGLSTGVGDPSPWTAEGVFLCLEAAARRLGRGLEGLRVSVKGVGSVGGKLARRLAASGARVIVSDIRADAAAALAAEIGAETAAIEEAAFLDADVYAPCALGAEFNAETIPKLQAAIICGAANNQLATEADAERLRAHGALYCPDYLVNAGGLISVARPPLKLSEEAGRRKLVALPETLNRVFDIAETEHSSPAAVADRLAEERFMGRRGQA